MWIVEQIEAIPEEFDFSSSDQGCQSVTAIAAKGVLLINAIELLEVDSSATQVTICEYCGCPRCASGDWVTFKRIGESVVWIPAWNAMEGGLWERSNYEPPYFMSSRGAPVFSTNAWEELRTFHNDLPGADTLALLDSREAARLCQWAAPGQILGEFPAEPKLIRDALIAVTDGELKTEAEEIDRCLHEHYAAPRPMEMAPSSVSIKPIELWLDLPETPGWKNFAHVNDQVCILVDGDFALMREGG